MLKRLLGVGLLCLFLGGVAAAADDQLAEGERLGRSCAGCHGTAGVSPGKLIPIIGGQVDKYIVKTMEEFAADKRPGSAMLNLAKGYSAEEQKQLAAYFAAQPWVNTPHAAENSADAALVKSCQGCHGSKGEGRGAFPRLAGQHPDYLYQALMEYKSGERTAPVMKLVTRIDDATLKQMADYYSALK